jgi:excisionase family DNA binding protein
LGEKNKSPNGRIVFSGLFLLLFETRERIMKNDNEQSSKQPTSKEWLTSKEAAKYLGISEGTLRNLTSNGHIQYYKFRRLNRYKPTDLDLLIKKK